MIPRVIQQLLGALYCHRALGSQQLCHLEPGFHGLALGLVHLANKAHGQRLPGVKCPRRQAHVLDPAEAPHALWQPAKRANVRSQSNVHFLHSESRIGSAYPHVSAGRQVDRQAYANAVQDTNHR